MPRPAAEPQCDWQLAVSLTLPQKDADQIKAQGCSMIDTRGKRGLARE